MFETQFTRSILKWPLTSSLQHKSWHSHQVSQTRNQFSEKNPITESIGLGDQPVDFFWNDSVHMV